MEEVITLLEQLTLVFAKSEPTINAHEFINYELEFDLNKPYISTNEEIIDMFDERDDITNNKSIEKADNVQICDMVVDRV